MITFPVDKLYLVRNKLQADILLPYPSLDAHPKDTLRAGHCMIGDTRLLQALEGWLEIIEVVSGAKDLEISLPTADAKVEEGNAGEPIAALLERCWQISRGSYLKVGRIADIAAEYPSMIPNCSDSGGKKTLFSIGRQFRILVNCNPPGWKIQSRKRSHTVEYSITPEDAHRS